MTVGEMFERMTVAEFEGWKAYAALLERER
jgi:hypothetical protein